ncbi:hypothetical protein V565_197860 [Rhizoctonia solani 123E]|uniref:Uncharacterized protein n=1 Tax=Rhizoctonia solani 123E TaxID=1423351 RepID=A0A074RH57_9AGAM|nr:hypothetical protein V565_197840 [Rhizoctonia solani 123E]KEP46461.1 hypothetical protein V565_197860 [Rhizoctonia solani 123E]
MAQPAAAQATPTGPPGEPRPVSRPPSQTGSATIRPAADPDWKAHVGWDGKFHPLNDVTYGQRPEAKKLRKIVEKSFIIPAWLADIESLEWAGYYKHTRRLRSIALSLSSDLSVAGVTSVTDDEDLSFDVQESLAFILHIPRHAIALKTHLDLEPVEADRRHPIDTLGSLVWDLQSDERVVYRTERKLAIPCPQTQARRENMGQVQPDACAFIYFPIIAPPVAARAALSTTADHRFAPHWVTEYKRDCNELDSKHQVAEGLVSALYQRRAYGFPDHFVFGSAHYDQTTIEVVAATWVPSAEPVHPAAPSQEAKTASAVPPEEQKANPPGNSLPGTTSSPPKTGKEVIGANASLTIQEATKYNKVLHINWFGIRLLTRMQIVMYSIAKYDMTAAENMLKLYLLMRHTLTLAAKYKDEIVKDDCARVRELQKEAKEFYQWPPPPPPPRSDEGTKRQRTGGSEYSHSLDTVLEHKRTDMTIDPYEGSDYSSDSEEFEPPNDAGPLRRIAGEGW